MTTRISPDKVAATLRLQICSTCRYRKTGGTEASEHPHLLCENECPLLGNVPALIDAVEQLDPMVGDRKRLIVLLLGRIAQVPVGPGNRYYHFGKKVADCLDNALQD